MRRKRRTARVDRGLLTLAAIVANVRSATGAIDDPAEEADIDAALEWIHSHPHVRKRS